MDRPAILKSFLIRNIMTGQVLAAAAIAVSIANSPEARAQSLTDALISAYSNNPTLQAQRASLRAVDEEAPQALSNWRPTISATSDFTREITRRNTRADGKKRAVQSPRGVELTVSQPLFRGFRTQAAISSAENEIRAARNRLLNVEQETLLDAVTAYMDVVRNQAILELNIGNQQVLRRQLEAADDRFEVGEITRTDVSQAKARLSGATAERIQAEGNLEISRATYLNVIGEVPGKLVRPTKDFADLPEHKNAALNLAEKIHPTVKAAIYDERAAHDDVKETEGELLPRLTLNGAINYRNELVTDSDFSTERSIGATLTVPLYQSGSVYSRIRQAKQTAGQQRRLVDQARRTVQEGASQAWQTLLTVRARIESFKAQVEANEIALEGVQREAAVGSRTVLDILDAEQELLDAKVNLVGAQRDETVAIFSVKSTTGQLTAEQLKLKVDIYDPFKHYNEIRGKWFGTQASEQIENTPIPGY
jgi:TolC family type I secretion outer membrane protein